MSRRTSALADDQEAARQRLVRPDPDAPRAATPIAPATALTVATHIGPGRGSMPAQAILQLQQALGNRAVGRLLGPPAPAAGKEPAADLGSRLQSAAGGGATLDPSVQRRLEAGLGTGLAGLRVHADDEADHLAQSVDATAFTTGADIYFRSGTYNPSTSDGLQLLAHEAAHAVQQSKGPVDGIPTPAGVAISQPDDPFERAADLSAQAVLSGASDLATVSPAPQSATPAQRQAAPEDEDDTPAVQLKSATSGLYLQR